MYDYHLYSRSADYGSNPNFLHYSALTNGGFASLYAVTKQDAEAIQREGTAAGYKGTVWSTKLWLDFDSPEASERALSRLKTMGLDYAVYDTGNRGVHVGIRRDCSPSHLLPARDRQWVKENFPEADASIYTHLHPFRLGGTIHEKTGRRKSLLHHTRGSSLILPPLRRESVRSAIRQERGQRRSVFDCFRVMHNTIPVEAGERHYTLIKLIYALKDEAGLDLDTAHFWVTEWNRMLSEPKGQDEIEKALRSIYL